MQFGEAQVDAIFSRIKNFFLSIQQVHHNLLVDYPQVDYFKADGTK